MVLAASAAEDSHLRFLVLSMVHERPGNKNKRKKKEGGKTRLHARKKQRRKEGKRRAEKGRQDKMSADKSRLFHVW